MSFLRSAGTAAAFGPRPGRRTGFPPSAAARRPAVRRGRGTAR